ncbi:DUF7010 family protein [Alteribacter populi]|uniref:DUF7010 family protein n=1 Tax=Alteribacter populi TaxID=2011011 RepID=UPI000BBB64B0|nr:hypothetical protein [Alteribacter populi]
MADINKFHDSLSIRTEKGTPMLYAGSIFWLVTGLSYFFITEDVRFWIYIYGAGMVFPLGIFVSKLLNIDLFAKDNPLSTIAGLIGAVQLFFIPVLLLLISTNQEIIPFVLAILLGAHFLPYMWVYKTKLFVVHSLLVISIALLSFFLPHGLLILSMALTLEFFIIGLLLKREVKEIKKVK